MKKTTPLLFAASLVARQLSTELGESEMTWGIRLTNWRRPGRNSPLPHVDNQVGRPGYQPDDVRKFIDARLAERATITPPNSNDPQTAKATAVADVEAERPFVRVMWNAGAAQGAFGLSVDGAKQLAARLNQAVAKVGLIKRERLI